MDRPWSCLWQLEKIDIPRQQPLRHTEGRKAINIARRNMQKRPQGHDPGDNLRRIFKGGLLPLRYPAAGSQFPFPSVGSGFFCPAPG